MLRHSTNVVYIIDLSLFYIYTLIVTDKTTINSLGLFRTNNNRINRCSNSEHTCPYTQSRQLIYVTLLPFCILFCICIYRFTRSHAMKHVVFKRFVIHYSFIIFIRFVKAYLNRCYYLYHSYILHQLHTSCILL